VLSFPDGSSLTRLHPLPTSSLHTARTLDSNPPRLHIDNTTGTQICANSIVLATLGEPSVFQDTGHCPLSIDEVQTRRATAPLKIADDFGNMPSRRLHQKSRHGCDQCKTRRVKVKLAISARRSFPIEMLTKPFLVR